jgi:hypothetical protein
MSVLPASGGASRRGSRGGRERDSSWLIYAFRFRDLRVIVTLDFLLDGISRRQVEEALSDLLFSRNLPPHELQAAPATARSDASFFLSRRPQGRVQLRLSFLNQTIAYRAPEGELAEDVLKVVLQALALKASKRGLVLLHAAALGTPQGAILIPGPSGTGKSTLSLWWLAARQPLFASETAVVGREGVHGGNTVLTIKREAAVRLLAGDLPAASWTSGEYIHFRYTFPSPFPSPVRGVVFIKLVERGSPIVKVPISPRRASMKLYEAAHWLVAGGFLVGGQTHPALPSRDLSSLRRIAEVTRWLASSQVHLHWVEGGAEAIGHWLTTEFAG